MTDATDATTDERRIDATGREAIAVLAAVTLALAIGAAVALAGVGLAVATGTVAAGDNVAVFSPDPSEVEAAPGETFAVDVRMVSHGGYGDDGVVAVDFVARYHPDYLEVVDVERGPWLEQGEETEVRSTTTLAHDEGTAIAEQRRDPPAGGATGTDDIATLTVRVADDAPPSEATIDFSETGVSLESQYPQPVHDRNVTVSIAGGGERHEGFDHADPADVLAEHPDEEANGSDEGSADGTDETARTDDAGTDETTAGEDDPAGAVESIPGFTALSGLGAIAAGVAGLALVRARRR